MENEDPNNSSNAGALSIYGQQDAAMDDFPVLKAFQQYIDAEQSKSRKRMILLCMFFGALMTILVAVFVFMIAQMNRDKQHVNDQLIEFLMKERERAPAPVAPQPAQPAANPAQDAALKAMTETLTAMQRQMDERRKAEEDAAAAAPTKADLERERRASEEAARLRKIQEKIEAEKRALAEEKERLRQQEIERQRRRLYPDYYQKQEKGAQAPSQPQVQPPSPKPKPKRRELSDADIDDILREVDSLKLIDEVDAEKRETKAKPKAKTTAKPKKSPKKTDDDEPGDKKTTSDKPIEYFTETEYALPVKVNGDDASWSLSLE